MFFPIESKKQWNSRLRARIQRDLQTLAKANAMLNDRDEVTEEDIDKVIELTNLINYKFNPL